MGGRRLFRGSARRVRVVLVARVVGNDEVIDHDDVPGPVLCDQIEFFRKNVVIPVSVQIEEHTPAGEFVGELSDELSRVP